jgi:hypothetical protein
MSTVLSTTRSVGPAGTVLMPAGGNYYIETIFYQLEFITALGAGLTQLFIILQTSGAHNISSLIYGYNAPAAGTTNFNLPFIFPGLKLVLPRGEGMNIVTASGANVSQCAISVNIYGSSLP